MEGGTLVKDVFCFQSPLGILGRIADAIAMKHYFTRFLTKRNQVIKTIAQSPEDWERFLEPNGS